MIQIWKQRYTRALKDLAELPEGKMAACCYLRMPPLQMNLLESEGLVISFKICGSDYWPGTHIGYKITQKGRETLKVKS